MAKMTKFNPEAFRAEVASLPSNDAADVATFWRQKLVTAKNEMAASTENALEIGITGATALGLSYLQGGWSFERQKELNAWNAGGAVAAGKSKLDANGKELSSPFVEGGKEDPTEFMGISKTLVATIILGVTSVFNLAGKKYTPFVRSAALGAMATWAGGMGHDWGFQAASDAATSVAVSA